MEDTTFARRIPDVVVVPREMIIDFGIWLASFAIATVLVLTLGAPAALAIVALVALTSLGV